MTRSAKATAENPAKNVKAKSGLNRSILKQSWCISHRRLTDKVAYAATPIEVIFINPACTSIRSPRCGHTQPEEPSNLLLPSVWLHRSPRPKCSQEHNSQEHHCHTACQGRKGQSHAASIQTKHSDPVNIVNQPKLREQPRSPVCKVGEDVTIFTTEQGVGPTTTPATR